MKSRLIRGGIFSLLLMVLTAALILFIYSKFISVYFKNSPRRGSPGIETLSEQGIDTSSYKTIIDSTKQKVEGINKKHLEVLDNIYEREK